MKRRGFLKFSSLAAGGALMRSKVAAAHLLAFEPSRREVALDVETTGLDPGLGHRIVTLSAMEIIDGQITGGGIFYCLDPERDIDAGAFAAHGQMRVFLTGRPKFSEIPDELTRFIGDATLVIHNASFDLCFLDSEFERLGRKPVFRSWLRVVDTLALARSKGLSRVDFPHLCARYGIPYDPRQFRTVEAVARVYLAMTGSPAL